MQKEEIFALLDRLYLDQTQYNKFFEYLSTFTREPRCKKGCLAFVEEIFNLPQIEGRDQLAIRLVFSKTLTNAYDTRHFVEDHPITVGYGEALKQGRLVVLRHIADYVLETARRLDESTLLDKVERQVYLRRAVARLLTVFHAKLPVALKTEQWSEVEPHEWIDYLNSDLGTLVKRIDNDEVIIKWSSHLYDYNHLDNDENLASLKSFLEYLDTFTEY